MSEPAAAVSAPADGPAFVGRSDLVSALGRRWNSARAGTGHLVLISGEAGVGKTRLATNALRRFDGIEALHTARSYPRDVGAAGAMLLDLAGSYRRGGDSATADRLRELLLAETTDQRDLLRAERLRVIELVDAIAASAVRPTLLCIDDLQWADDLSLAVLERLSAVLPTLPLLVLATCRSDDFLGDAPIRAWRSSLLVRRLGEELRVPRLDPDETALLVAGLLGRRPSAVFLETLIARSDGIPLHIEELLAAGAGALPETIADGLVARLGELPAAARRLAEISALIGRAARHAELTALAGVSPAEGEDALRILVDRAIAVVDREGAVDLRHALWRDAIVASVSSSDRELLHRSIAERGVVTGERDAYISDHFERAGLLDLAHVHALRAATQAMALRAHREAALLYGRAMRTLPAGTGPAEEAWLSAVLGRELMSIDEIDEAAIRLDDAVRLYRDLGDERSAGSLIPGLMAARHLLGADLDARAALADEALERMSGDDGSDADAIRAEVYAALSAAYMLDRRLEESLDAGARARRATAPGTAIARSIDLDATVGSVLVFAGDESGWALLESATQAGERSGAESSAARAHRMLASCASALVEYDRAERTLTAGIAYCESVESWNDVHYLLAHRAHVAWAVGDWDIADRLSASSLAEERGGVTTRITALHAAGYVALGRGNLDRALRLLTEAADLGGRMNELQRLSPALWGLAEVAIAGSRPDEAIEMLERAFEHSALVGDAAYLYPHVVTGVRAHLAQRDHVGALEWLERCATPLRKRGIHGTLPAIEHARGLIELAAGRTGSARELLESASAGWTTRRRWWEGTSSLLDLAQVATRSRRPADSARLAHDARARGRIVGAAALVARADAMLESLAPDQIGVLTAREFEVAELVARGATNREIAAALTISPKTASAHIEHILSKLGVSRRAEIASWVSSGGSDR